MIAIDYFKETVSNGTLEIEDIGNCAVSAYDDDGKCYILVVDTSMGFSRIFTFGPVDPDLNTLPNSVACLYNRQPYNQRKLIKVVKEFLNSPFRKITTAQNVTKEEALDLCRDLVAYMKEDRNF